MGVRRHLRPCALSVLRLLTLCGLVWPAGGDSQLRPRALLLVRLLVLLDQLLRSSGLFDAEFWLRQLWPSRDGSVERIMRHSDVRIDFARMPQWLFGFAGGRNDTEACCSRR